ADMTGCGCLLSRSLLGVKRTWAGAVQMSAFDPKQTLPRAPSSPSKKLLSVRGMRVAIRSMLLIGRAVSHAQRLVVQKQEPTPAPEEGGFTMTSGQPGPLLLVTALAWVAWVAWVAPAPALTTFMDSGADAASITDTVNAFRAALGDPNNGNNPGPLSSGRREINWDGGGPPVINGTAPVTPFTTFQDSRGATFTTPGTRLTLAAVTAGTLRLDMIHTLYTPL